jgi:hypothetical protein
MARFPFFGSIVALGFVASAHFPAQAQVAADPGPGAVVSSFWAANTTASADDNGLAGTSWTCGEDPGTSSATPIERFEFLDATRVRATFRDTFGLYKRKRKLTSEGSYTVTGDDVVIKIDKSGNTLKHVYKGKRREDDMTLYVTFEVVDPTDGRTRGDTNHKLPLFRRVK